MLEFFLPFTSGAIQFGWQDIVDILIVAVIIYCIIRITRGTRAFQVLKGLAIIIIAAVVFSIFNFQTVSWILGMIVSALAIILVILFQQEIKRGLEKLGSFKMFGFSFKTMANADQVISETVKAVTDLSMHKTGALIVIECKTGLLDIRETGIEIDAEVRSELIKNIFYPNTPLHDGAMIISNGRISSAGCFLPLSNTRSIDSSLGTRHRAAIGISEVSDSYVIVVSEETGIISYANDGRLYSNLDFTKLHELLEEILVKTDDQKNKKEPGAGKKKKK